MSLIEVLIRIFVYIFLSCNLVKRAKSQVAVDPSESVLGGTAEFTCMRTTASIEIESVEWLLNGTLLDNFNFSESDVTQRFIRFNGGIGRLVFNNLPLMPQITEIVCRATLRNGATVLSTATNLIVLQGLLSAVGSLMATIENSTISLTWTAPSTQEEIDADPVINGYCVDVATSSSTLASQCGITETMFSFPINPDIGSANYTFTVTPVSPGGNGTSAVEVLYVDSPEMTTFRASVSNSSTTQIDITLQEVQEQDNFALGLGIGISALLVVIIIAIGIVGIIYAAAKNNNKISDEPEETLDSK